MRPFWAMFLVNVVNVAASLYCVYELGWGVKGLAAGTVIGWAAGAAMILWFLRPNSKVRREAGEEIPLELRLGNMRYDTKNIAQNGRIVSP